MKKSIFMFSMTLLIFFGGMNLTIAQEQPKPKKDTVNIDTDAKPTFYYAVEDEKSKAKGSSSATIPIIIGAVVVVGAAGFFFLKKKK